MRWQFPAPVVAAIVGQPTEHGPAAGAQVSLTDLARVADAITLVLGLHAQVGKGAPDIAPATLERLCLLPAGCLCVSSSALNAVSRRLRVGAGAAVPARHEIHGVDERQPVRCRHHAARWRRTRPARLPGCSTKARLSRWTAAAAPRWTLPCVDNAPGVFRHRSQPGSDDEVAEQIDATLVQTDRLRAVSPHAVALTPQGPEWPHLGRQGLASPMSPWGRAASCWWPMAVGPAHPARRLAPG